MKKKITFFLAIFIIILLPFTALSSTLKLIQLKIGSKTAYVDMNRVVLDVAPIEIDGRTLVPLRFLAEHMGAKNINYSPETEEITMELMDATELSQECENLKILLTNCQTENQNLKNQVQGLNQRINELENQKTPNQIQKPYPPKNVRCSHLNNQVTLMWYPAKQGTNSLSGYNVYKYNPTDGTFLLASALPIATTVFMDSDIHEGNTYQYYVTAFDNGVSPMESDQSNIAFVTISTTQQPPPQQPDPPNEDKNIGKSRNNPVPIGQTFLTPDGFEITVSNLVKGKEAWDILRKANSYNDPPESGMQYIFISATVKNIDSSEEPEWISDIYFSYVGSSNKIVNSYDKSAVQPSEGIYQDLQGELFHGGETSGSIVFYVPESDYDMRLIWNHTIFNKDRMLYFEAI